MDPSPAPIQRKPSYPSSPAIKPLPERRGSKILPFTKRHIHKWRAPLFMVLFFLTGLALSVAHCVVYAKLKGRLVGNSNQQEAKLRYGTAFAFLSQICLSAAIWAAYTQWVWRTMQREEMTIGAWNAALSADVSALSLTNLEMLKKVRLGSAMAFFAWSLLLPPFFTPATLYVYGSIDIQEIWAATPFPSIGIFDEANRYTYSPPTQRGTRQHQNDTSRTFTGPRTQLSLIATLVASGGEIPWIFLPFNNAEYSTQFFAPIVRCTDANETEVEQMNDFLVQEMATVRNSWLETDSAYFAFVPTYNSTGDLTAVWHPRQQIPSKPVNELWMTFLRPTINSEGARVKPRHYQICRPHAASYNITITQYHGEQTVTGTYDVGAIIPFPTDNSPNAISNLTQHAYSAFMWVICDQLVGKFAWFNETQPLSPTAPQAAAQFGVIDSQIQRTALLGSSDLDAYFEMDEEKGLYDDRNISQIFNLSDQRKRDKDMARNRTLGVLVEELSFNTTVGLGHDPLLTRSVNTRLYLTLPASRYAYHPSGLFIPYTLALVFTFLCVVIGIISFIHDGVLPGKKVQDIIWAARNMAFETRPGLARRMSATVDGKGEVEIRVVEEV